VVGTGKWDVISGNVSFTDETLYNTTATANQIGANYITWTITYLGCANPDTMIITNNNPTNPNAGPDQEVCNGSATLAANDPSVGTGRWSTLVGGVTFANASLRNTTVSGLPQGVTALTWTVTYNGCSETENVNIDNIGYTVSAGPNFTDCDGNATLDGSDPAPGTGEWVLDSGNATIADDTKMDTDVTLNTQGTHRFLWTVTINSCSYTDDVVVTYDNPQPNPIAGINGGVTTICESYAELDGNAATNGTGYWSTFVPGVYFDDSTDPDATVYNMPSGTSRLYWNIQKGGCVLTDFIDITRIVNLSNAGSDDIVCLDNTTLDADPPALGTGTWTQENGTSTIFLPASDNSHERRGPFVEIGSLTI
jgi:hypothetical protein